MAGSTPANPSSFLYPKKSAGVCPPVTSSRLAATLGDPGRQRSFAYRFSLSEVSMLLASFLRESFIYNVQYKGEVIKIASSQATFFIFGPCLRLIQVH
eukprot:m.11229 g.11229  ORF g.11229 m.11229 type:complete len:98 (+) comp23095_c0_seq2:84-377(+)